MTPKLWTCGGSEPVEIGSLPFRLMRISGPDLGHTVTEIWNWPADQQEDVLGQCGYSVAPDKPDPLPGHRVEWDGDSRWEQRALIFIDVDAMFTVSSGAGGATLT